MNMKHADQTEIADLLLPFCEAASISHRDPTTVVKKRILASLVSFIDNEALHRRVFGQQSHIEWEHVQNYLSDAVLTLNEWMQILALIDFVDEPVVRDEVHDIIRNSAIKQGAGSQLIGNMSSFATSKCTTSRHANDRLVSPLESMRISMSKAQVNPLTWDKICKALLIVNLSGLDANSALTQLLELSPSMRSVTTDVLSNLSAFRHTPSEYENDIAFIMDSSRCRVREHMIVQSIDRVEAQATARRQNLQTTFSANKRPSLTQMLQAYHLTKGSSCDGKTPNEDSLSSFCKNARLSVNSNHRTKLIIYFLVCLPDSCGDKKGNIARVLGCNSVLSAAISNMVIVTPDLNALRDAVMGTKHAGGACEELRRFRECCVSATMINSNCLTWTAVLQLYLASYCRPMVTKDLFTHILTHYANGDAQWLQATASGEVDARLNTFARQWSMALTTVVDLMLQS